MNKFAPYPASVRFQVRGKTGAFFVFDTHTQAVAFYNGERAYFATHTEALRAKLALANQAKP